MNTEQTSKNIFMYNIGTSLRINKKKFQDEKNFQDEQLPHKLFLTSRQKAKTRNAFANNMSMDIKFSQLQLSEIIQ